MQTGRPAPGGFAYVALLLAVAVLGIGLMATSEVWVKTAERQKLAQLDWVGRQYAAAIESYYNTPVGSVPLYPPNLDELVKDSRYLGVKRHLRRLYVNPVTGAFDWMVVPAPGGGVMGVEVELLRGEERFRKRFLFAAAVAR